MHSSTRFTNTPIAVATTARRQHTADLVYQGMTIAAMLLLLGSLWVF